MIESFLFLPSAIKSQENSEAGNKFIRDLLLLSVVTTIDNYGVSAPRRIFVSLVIYIFICDILNDLTYKILPSKKSLRENWLALQKRQTERELRKYFAIKYANSNCQEKDCIDSVLLTGVLGDKE